MLMRNISSPCLHIPPTILSATCLVEHCNQRPEIAPFSSSHLTNSPSKTNHLLQTIETATRRTDFKIKTSTLLIMTVRLTTLNAGSRPFVWINQPWTTKIYAPRPKRNIPPWRWLGCGDGRMWPCRCPTEQTTRPSCIEPKQVHCLTLDEWVESKMRSSAVSAFFSRYKPHPVIEIRTAGRNCWHRYL